MNNKNKKYLFFITLVIISFFSLAQGGFKKKYFLQNSLSSWCRNVIEAPNGNLIMIGFTYDTTNNSGFAQLTIMGADGLGNVLWRKDFGNSSFEYLNNLFSMHGAVYQNSTAFYHVASVRDADNSQIGALIKFNYDGDTLWQKLFRETDPMDFLPQGITKSVDGGLLITGVSQEPGGRACLIIKTDINGNELWRKRINKVAPNVQDGRGIVQDSVSKKIVTVGYQYIGTSSNFSSYSNILILDSLGNKQVQTTFNNARGGGFNSVIQLSDGHFLTCGIWITKHDTIYDINECQSILVKFDANGNEIWKYKFGLPTYYQKMTFPYEMKNGDIMVLGHADSSEYFHLGHVTKIQLTRLDKNGAFIYSKCLGSSIASDFSTFEWPESFNRTMDGGFIISSSFQERMLTNKHPYSIIKIDSLGCDTTAQYCKEVELSTSPFYSITGYNFEVFPNPTSDFVNIKIDEPSDRNFVVSITDLNGRVIRFLEIESNQTQQMNTSIFSAGVYFLNVSYEGKSIETKKLVIVR